MPFYKGKEGHWITTDTGRHIFIEKGKTVKSVLNELFDEDYEFDPEEDLDSSFDEDPLFLNKPDFKGIVKVQKGTKEGTKETFLSCFDNRSYYDEELDNKIYQKIKSPNSPTIIKLKNNNNGKGACFMTNKNMIKIVLERYYTPEEILRPFYHEMGHCLDYIGSPNKYRSSEYISPKYGTNMVTMLDEEFKNNLTDETITNIIKELDGSKKSFRESIILEETVTAFGDLVQNVFGKDKCKKLFDGYVGHNDLANGKEYFSYRFLKGTECFAELCGSLGTDPEKHLINIFKKHAPKTLDIFYEILGGI